jgi:hypothetical protein
MSRLDVTYCGDGNWIIEDNERHQTYHIQGVFGELSWAVQEVLGITHLGLPGAAEEELAEGDIEWLAGLSLDTDGQGGI